MEKRQHLEINVPGNLRFIPVSYISVIEPSSLIDQISKAEKDLKDWINKHYQNIKKIKITIIPKYDNGFLLYASREETNEEFERRVSAVEAKKAKRLETTIKRRKTILERLEKEREEIEKKLQKLKKEPPTESLSSEEQEKIVI